MEKPQAFKALLTSSWGNAVKKNLFVNPSCSNCAIHNELIYAYHTLDCYGLVPGMLCKELVWDNWTIWH